MMKMGLMTAVLLLAAALPGWSQEVSPKRSAFGLLQGGALYGNKTGRGCGFRIQVDFAKKQIYLETEHNPFSNNPCEERGTTSIWHCGNQEPEICINETDPTRHLGLLLDGSLLLKKSQTLLGPSAIRQVEYFTEEAIQVGNSYGGWSNFEEICALASVTAFNKAARACSDAGYSPCRKVSEGQAGGGGSACKWEVTIRGVGMQPVPVLLDVGDR